jgi:membrane protein YqaA with SNARE-associated domain
LRPGSKTLAGLWGFAEATLFFIVPDVLLTALALRSQKSALSAAVIAALSATLGGMLVWFSATIAPETARTVLLAVPGISEDTFATVRDLLEAALFEGMVTGAFTGVPYKVFAAEAGSAGTGPWVFALLSPAARLPRFALMCLLARGLSALVGERLSDRSKLTVTLGLWAVFYVFYFAIVGW